LEKTEKMIFRIVVVLAVGVISLLGADPVAEAQKNIANKKYDAAIAVLESASRPVLRPEVRKALVEAHLAKADSFMSDSSLAPIQQLPLALQSYRNVLKYDAANPSAKAGIASIESTYKLFRMPVPANGSAIAAAPRPVPVFDEAETELSDFVNGELKLVDRGMGVFPESLKKLRTLFERIGDRWYKNPEPGGLKKPARTALIMNCRRYLKAAAFQAESYQTVLDVYVPAKASLDKISPYRDAYLQ
jgi:hypothetical protein